jgi:5'-nucleotidase / UDP-sugar diphosphatase
LRATESGAALPDMSRRLFLAALLAWQLLGRATAAPAGAEALLMVTADQHSAYARTAQFVALVDEMKAANPGLPVAVLLDGDTFEYGNVVARRSEGAIDFAMFAALARRAPTVLNLGNHEPEFFDLAETVKRVESTGIRVVTNIVNRTTNAPFAPAAVKLALGRDEAVVVGVTTDHRSTYRVAVRPSLDLSDPVTWAKNNFPTLLASAPLRIVLSHAGLIADRGMLPLVSDGTLFVGAHDHLRFVKSVGRTVYFHSGSWNEYASLVWLCRDAQGAPRWLVEQRKLDASSPGDPALAALIRETQQKYLTPSDLAVVGRLKNALSTSEAAQFVARAVRAATKADAAFIGNTTFGGGLPAGDVSQVALDDCVRFDGTICVATVTGARLRRLLAAANQGPDTPFERRRGEFNHAVGLPTIDDARTYRIATTDWGAKNTARYFGEPAIVWQEQPGEKLKAETVAALQLVH